MRHDTIVIFCLLLAAVALFHAPPANADTFVWDIVPGTVGAGNGVVNDGSGTWDTSSGNWTSDGGVNNVAWPNNTTDIAAFNGSAGGTVTVSGSFSAGGIVFSGAAGNGYTFSPTGGPTLTLGTDGFTVNSSSGVQTLNNRIGGNNALTVDDGGTLTLGGQNTFTGAINIGKASEGNSVNVTGKLTGGTSAHRFSVGGEAFDGEAYDNNSVDISGVGSAGSPTVYIGGANSSFWVGGSENSGSSGNSVIVRNGAYFRAAGGNGTTNSKIGANTDSTGNSVTVTGAGSTLSHSGHRFYVGENGSYNTLTVSDGGQVVARVFHTGVGGHNNAVIVTGNGSDLKANEDLLIGWNGTGSSNSVTVSDGGKLYSQTRSGRTEISCHIGSNSGANYNSLTVTGAGSAWTNNGYHVVLGATGSPSTPAWQAAHNNSVNIKSGASAVINTGVILSGINSSFNLGDGTNIGVAAVGSFRDGGVSLIVSDARLTFNSGRLIANVGGTLVSGPGMVNLSGAAYVSTTHTDSSIESVIGGHGSLVKEGSGALILTATNTCGATIVSNGVLRLTNTQCLSTNTAVFISDGAKIDLAFTGDNPIYSLTAGVEPLPPGRYGQAELGSYLSGPGYLLTLSGTGPEGALLLVR